MEREIYNEPEKSQLSEASGLYPRRDRGNCWTWPLTSRLKKKADIRHDQLRGKNIALIFEKTSTRTRCSFEVAAHDLGMEVTYLDPSGSQIGKRNPLRIPPGSWAGCLTASNTGATASRSLRIWPIMQAFPSGTA